METGRKFIRSKLFEFRTQVIHNTFYDVFEKIYLFHFSAGAGLPVARHFNVTFEPSRATTSVELNENQKYHFFLLLL